MFSLHGLCFLVDHVPSAENIAIEGSCHREVEEPWFAMAEPVTLVLLALIS